MMLRLILFLLLQTGTKGAIEGTVVRAGTREPIADARVVLQVVDTGLPFDYNRPPPLYSISSDAQGRFSFKELEPGMYRLSFSANGYVSQDFGQRAVFAQSSRINLGAGQEMKDLVTEMIPTGTVSGTIRDGDKRPLAGVPVRLMRIAYEYDGDKRLRPYGVVTKTDDRGDFRIYFVTPGRYYLNAGTQQGPPGNGDARLGANEVPANFSYVYYPGVEDLKFATAFDVQPGAVKTAMDVTVARLPGVTVKGRIIDSATGQAPETPKIRLSYRDPGAGWDYDLEYMGRQKAIYKDGSFEFRNVLPGLFTVSASVDEPGTPARQPEVRAPEPLQRRGYVPVEVAGTDIEGIVVTVSPGTSIAGRLRVEGRQDSSIGPLTTNPTPGVTLAHSSNGGKPSIPGLQPPTDGKLSADGAFRINNVMPGEFRLEVNWTKPDFYLKEARFGSQDLLRNPLQFNGRETGTLEVLMSPNVASVEGVVMDRLAGVRGAQVVLVPDTARFRTELFKTATTDQNGRFTIRDVAPGDYKIYAWESIETFSWFDPEVLSKYEQYARPVRLTESSKQTIDPRLISATVQ